MDYYKLLDEKIGRLLSVVDKDTTVLVVSDHGAKAMKGAFCINECCYRSAGTVGHGKLFLDENDTGPDDAVHDWDGVFIAWGKKGRPDITSTQSNLSILDVHRIVLQTLKLQPQ